MQIRIKDECEVHVFVQEYTTPPTTHHAHSSPLPPHAHHTHSSPLLPHAHHTQVGHGSTVDALQLLKHYGINTKNIFDTESFASQLKTNLVSLKGLAAMFLGLRIVKAKQMSNWERQTLSTGQVDYASGDAWAALQVYFAMLQYVWYTVCVASYPAGRSLVPRPTPFFFFFLCFGLHSV